MNRKAHSGHWDVMAESPSRKKLLSQLLEMLSVCKSLACSRFSCRDSFQPKPFPSRSDPHPVTDSTRIFMPAHFSPLMDNFDGRSKLQSSHGMSGHHCNLNSPSAQFCFLPQVLTHNIYPALQSLTQHLVLQNLTWDKVPLDGTSLRKRIWWI